MVTAPAVTTQSKAARAREPVSVIQADERSDTRGARQAAIWAIALCNDTTNQIVSIAWACVSSDSD